MGFLGGSLSYLKEFKEMTIGKNYANPWFIIFALIFVLFIISIIYVSINIENKTSEDELLDIIKEDVLKQNRFSYSKDELNKEMEKVNELINQEKIEKMLGLTRNSKGKLKIKKTNGVDDSESSESEENNNKLNVNKYGNKGEGEPTDEAKDDQMFEGEDEQYGKVNAHSTNMPYKERRNTDNPPKKKSKSEGKNKKKSNKSGKSKKNKDADKVKKKKKKYAYDIGANEDEEEEDDEEEDEEGDDANEKRKKKKNNKSQQQPNLENENPLKFKYYNVRNYKPETDNKNKNLEDLEDDGEVDFYYNNILNQTKNKKKNQENLNVDLFVNKDPEKESSEPSIDINVKNNNMKDYKSTNFNNLKMKKDDQDDSYDNDPVDYFDIYITGKARKKINQMKNNPISEQFKNAAFIKEEALSIKLLGFYDYIDELDPPFKEMYLDLLLYRNVYISPFSFELVLYPRWKRIILLYMYLLLQMFFIGLYLTLMENLNFHKALKGAIVVFASLITADAILIPIIFLFRIDSKFKQHLFILLRSRDQMKLVLHFNKIKRFMAIKFFLAGLPLFIIIFALTFYLTFLYTISYKSSRAVFIASFFIGFTVDIVGFEFLMLYFLADDFMKRKEDYDNYDNAYKRLFTWKNFRVGL